MGLQKAMTRLGGLLQGHCVKILRSAGLGVASRLWCSLFGVGHNSLKGHRHRDAG